MEESLTISAFLEQYRTLMGMEEEQAENYSPLILAYIGDAVYEVIVRAKVINKGNTQMNKLHKMSSALVKASAQAAMIKALDGELTAQEQAAYRRGRNAKSPTMAKNATMIDYRMATGFEVLVGWLFLKREYLRLAELVALGLEKSGLLELHHEEKMNEI